MKKLKTYNQLFEQNSERNSIFTYIKTHKNDIDYDIIRNFLDGHNFFPKNNDKHLSLLVFTLRKLQPEQLIIIWKIFIEYGCDFNTSSYSNIIQIIYREFNDPFFIINMSPGLNMKERFEKYKDVFIFLFDNKIDLFHVREFYGNFFDILEDDLPIFAEIFSDNKYFSDNYEKRKREKTVRKFKL